MRRPGGAALLKVIASPHKNFAWRFLVANGATTRETASQLFLSPKTIEFHLGHIYRKLDVRSRTELARHPTLTESPRRPTPSANATPVGGGFL